MIVDAVDQDDNFPHRSDGRPVDGLLDRLPVRLDLQSDPLKARRALDLDRCRDLPVLVRGSRSDTHSHEVDVICPQSRGECLGVDTRR